MKYEHYVIQKYPHTAWLDAQDLNSLANDDGWILINAVCPDDNTQIYTFRREVKENSRL